MKLFLDWIQKYSDLHFKIIKILFNNNGFTRFDIWKQLNSSKVMPRENSRDADLYKLIFRDLSTGGIIRQYKPINHAGEYIKIPKQGGRKTHSNIMKSAFDGDESYELTSLGADFIHFATTEVAPKLKYQEE